MARPGVQPHGAAGMSARMRAEFEAEFKRKFPLTYQAALSGESKAHGDLSNAWWGWEASRQALGVELPSEQDGDGYDEGYYCHGYNCGFSDAADAIRAAGIRIKGDV